MSVVVGVVDAGTEPTLELRGARPEDGHFSGDHGATPGPYRRRPHLLGRIHILIAGSVDLDIEDTEVVKSLLVRTLV